MADDLTGLLGTLIVLGVAKKIIEDKPAPQARAPPARAAPLARPLPTRTLPAFPKLFKK